MYNIKSKTIKSNPQLIDYYQYLNNDSKNLACVCQPVVEKSFSSQTNYANISNNQRIANILTSSVGGRIQFGNSNGIFLSTNSNNSINYNNYNNYILGLGPRNKF
jgi:hypothetical protein